MFKKASIWVPTWRGWLLLLIVSVVAMYGAVRGVHPFLAMHRPVSAEVLVVEGWVPDYALAEGLDFCAKHNCRYLLLAGGAVKAEPDPEMGDVNAESVEESLRRIAGKAGPFRQIRLPETGRDRTYGSAEGVRAWLADQGVEVESINVLTLGPHARRSRLLFQKAFGPEVEVGVISVRNRGYDPAEWWRYSNGVKEVVSEAAAYLYAHFLFRPDE